MLMPRTYELVRSFSNLGRLQFILPALVLWAIWAWTERSAKTARFTTLMIGAGLVMYLVQKAGSGVDENAQFELIFAAAIGIGIAYDRLPSDPLRTGWSPNAIRALVLGVLIARLLLSTRLEFAYVHRQSAIPRARLPSTRQSREPKPRASPRCPGPVACSNLVICRAAGKPFVFDPFKADMMVTTGTISAFQLYETMRRQGIAADNTDPRANVTSLWRRMRSD